MVKVWPLAIITSSVLAGIPAGLQMDELLQVPDETVVLVTAHAAGPSITSRPANSACLIKLNFMALFEEQYSFIV
jgi:hypothetical protein